jgi:hypothetical protein
MLEFKQGVAARVPIRLLDAAGAAVSGVVFGDVTCAIEKSDGSTDVVAVDGANWIELVAGAFAGLGKYTLVIPLGSINLPGIFTYAIAAVGTVGYIGVVKVVANEEADSIAALANTPGLVWDEALASHVAAASVGEALKFAKLAVAARVRINRVTMQLDVYEEDGVTIAFSHDLKDLDGLPTDVDATERGPRV